ncbi:MAG: hypothetical protein NZL96_00265 [Patescibacteria group bacterium]|nr:hypothetical protein [Patescibacteria group bacterium]
MLIVIAKHNVLDFFVVDEVADDNYLLFSNGGDLGLDTSFFRDKKKVSF